MKKVAKKFGGFVKSDYLCTRKSETGTFLQVDFRSATNYGGSVAQLNRASDYGSEGCGFESRRNHKINAIKRDVLDEFSRISVQVSAESILYAERRRK